MNITGGLETTLKITWVQILEGKEAFIVLAVVSKRLSRTIIERKTKVNIVLLKALTISEFHHMVISTNSIHNNNITISKEKSRKVNIATNWYDLDYLGLFEDKQL